MPKQAQNKTQPTKVSVKDFLAELKDEQKRQDAQELVKMMQKISGHPPVMWGPSIIGFDKSHYKYESGREGDTGIIGFSPRSTSLVIYLVDGISKYSKVLDKLGPHKTSKVCLYIKHLKDVDMKVLEQIIKTSYQYVKKQGDHMHRAE